MLNLGRYPGKGMPNVTVRPVLIDWILIGLAVLPFVAIWACTILFREELSVYGNEFYAWGAVSALIIILLLFTLRIPVKWVNFPVRVTEQNIWVQYLLVIRFTRILCIELNLMFLFRLFHQLGPVWGINSGVFDILSLAVLVIMVISFAGYYVVAMRYRSL